MSNANLPVKRDNGEIVRSILFGPLGELIYKQVTKTDFDRQRETVIKMKKNGMEHGHVRLKSTREMRYGDKSYKQTHEGEYTW